VTGPRRGVVQDDEDEPPESEPNPASSPPRRRCSSSSSSLSMMRLRSDTQLVISRPSLSLSLALCWTCATWRPTRPPACPLKYTAGQVARRLRIERTSERSASDSSVRVSLSRTRQQPVKKMPKFIKERPPPSFHGLINPK
jgi:hypothetical protein